MIHMKQLHSDERGDIYLITGDLKEHDELTVFTTKKGFARGGCVHNIHDEHCVVLEGVIKYHIGKKLLLMRKGDVVTIKKKTPHFFISITDSVVVEWGATPVEKKHKHPEFRKMMEDHNARNN